MKLQLLSLLFGLTLFPCSHSTMVHAQEKIAPLKVGVVGLVHAHVHGILNHMGRGDYEIVGIAEPNADLARRYAKQYDFDISLVYPSLTEMLEATQPQAVTAFNSIYGHREVVRECAPRNIHVMVEKPLAVSLAHAQEMAQLARKHSILLLTNYETTWYSSNAKAYQLVQNQELGPLRKIVVHDGHAGPKEIGCGPEFLEWLTDPKLNGGGAITDFGCYGANLITQLMGNERPISVTAITQQIKPEIYPKVDDEATILLRYPNTQGVIQASWNWPFSRKDMEVYGKTGYAICEDGSRMRIRLAGQHEEEKVSAPQIQSPRNDPFTLFASAVRGTTKISPSELSSLENNLIVMEILEAAKQSASSGKTVALGEDE